MADEKIREWVQEKLEEGTDEQRIKNSLENTGHDPSIVEDVKAGFTDTDVEEDPFNEVDQEKDHNIFEDTEEEEESTGSKEEEEESKKFQIPEISEIQAKMDWKYAAIPLVLILFLAGGFMFQSSEVLEPEKDCARVKIYGVNTNQGSTVADVRVLEESNVVLEVFEDGQLKDRNYKVMEGKGQIEVNEVGDKVSFHGAKCQKWVSDRSY